MCPLFYTFIVLLFLPPLTEPIEQCADYSRDCERRSDLCFTKVELMHKSCPKTCHVCEAAAAASPAPASVSALSSSLTHHRPSKKAACRDIAADCDETADLCDHASFKKMMKKQCAKTCGFCTPSRGTRPSDDLLTISGLAGETGEGRSNVRGSSTSKTKAPKGIDGLSISELVKLIRGAETTDTTQTTCADMAYDCPIKQGLCGNSRYNKLMLKMCQRTCNLCNAATTAPPVAGTKT